MGHFEQAFIYYAAATVLWSRIILFVFVLSIHVYFNYVFLERVTTEDTMGWSFGITVVLLDLVVIGTELSKTGHRMLDLDVLILLPFSDCSKDEDLSVNTPQATAVPPVLVPVVDPEADGPNVVNTMPSTSTDPLLLPPSSTSSDILSSPVVPEPATELLPFTDGLTPAEIVASIEPLVSERPLILYAYSDGKTMKERKNARENFEFFLAHGLNAASDFVFIFNGKTDAVKLVPKELNIRIVERANDCYDIGAYAEVLTTDDLYKGYKKFIMLNASIRGPFVPYWAKSCWTDMYLGRITDEVKVCTTICFPYEHSLTQIKAHWHDRQLLAYVPRPIHDLGNRHHRLDSSPLPHPRSCRQALYRASE